MAASAVSMAAVTGHGTRAALAQTPKKGGTLRVGFYIEAVTLTRTSPGAKSTGRSITTSTSRW